MALPPSPWRPSRREFLGAAGLTLLAAACSGSKSKIAQSTGGQSSGPSPAPGSLDDLARGTSPLSVVSGNLPASPGEVRFAFYLSDANQQLISGGAPQVWAASDETSKALGPVSATWYPFTAYSLTHDKSPESKLPGTYEAVLSIPTSGNWFIGVSVKGGGLNGFGTAAQPIAQGLANPVGSKATSVQTPVATSDADIAKICTRTPVCHLHAISLDAALTNGKPTVAGFSTPLLCESQLCGPVTDEVILLAETYGTQANIIHVEEFLRRPDGSLPGPSLENQSPGFKAWKLDSEPWVFVMDGQGIIRAAFGAGPSTAPQYEAALKPLL